MTMVAVEIKFIDNYLRTEYGHPTRGSAFAAAVDLRACGLSLPMRIPSRGTFTCSAGFAMHIKDPAIAALIIPRSGLGFKHRIGLNNTTGLIDPDYQGEIKIALENRGFNDFVLKPYDRVAQMLFVPIYMPAWDHVDEFTQLTARGMDGIGSTGTK